MQSACAMTKGTGTGCTVCVQLQGPGLGFGLRALVVEVEDLRVNSGRWHLRLLEWGWVLPIIALIVTRRR